MNVFAETIAALVKLFSSNIPQTQLSGVLLSDICRNYLLRNHGERDIALHLWRRSNLV